MFARTIAPLALIVAGFLATACVTTPRPQLTEPETTIEVMRNAYAKDDAGLFLHTLGKPVLREYSEHIIRVGWSEIRPRVGEFVERAEIVETDDYTPGERDLNVPADYVWPDDGAKLMRVRLRLDGEEEDFLLEREVDDPPENTKQADGFWIGDRYYVKREHVSPKTYMEGDSPESERTHWRIVFPYHPFQHNGPLTARLVDTMANQK